MTRLAILALGGPIEWIDLRVRQRAHDTRPRITDQNTPFRHLGAGAPAGMARSGASALEPLAHNQSTALSRTLHDLGDFTWYDPPVDQMLCDFRFVVCDGPLSRAARGCLGPRCRLLPVPRTHLPPQC